MLFCPVFLPLYFIGGNRLRNYKKSHSLRKEWDRIFQQKNVNAQPPDFVQAKAGQNINALQVVESLSVGVLWGLLGKLGCLGVDNRVGFCPLRPFRPS